MENSQELQQYIEFLKTLPTKNVYTNNLVKGIYSPFINNVLFFSYQNPDAKQAMDMFPIIVCFGFSVDKFNNKYWLKGLNLNYLPIPLRIEVVKYLQSLRDELKVKDNEMVEYNAYKMFKAYFGDIIDSCYKKYDTDHISFMKIVPSYKWNTMCNFPLNTFMDLVKNESKKATK